MMKPQRSQPGVDLDTMLAALAEPRVPLHVRERVLREVHDPGSMIELELPRRGSLWAPVLAMAALCLFIVGLIGSIAASYRPSPAVLIAAMPEGSPRVVRFIMPNGAALEPVPVLVGTRTRVAMEEAVAELAQPAHVRRGFW